MTTSPSVKVMFRLACSICHVSVEQLVERETHLAGSQGTENSSLEELIIIILAVHILIILILVLIILKVVILVIILSGDISICLSLLGLLDNLSESLLGIELKFVRRQVTLDIGILVLRVGCLEECSGKGLVSDLDD